MYLFLFLYNDYFENSLTTKETESLSWELWSNPLVNKYHKKSFLNKHNKFFSFINNFTDLTWESKSKHFTEGKKELNEELKELVKVYETYFTSEKNILKKKNYPITLVSNTLKLKKH